MADSYIVAFNGQLAEGRQIDTVKQGVAQLFKVKVARVEPLFSGQWVSIKKGVDEATAKRYQGAMAKVGALCEVVTATQFAALKSRQPETVPPAVADNPPPPQSAAPAERREGAGGLPSRPEHLVLEPSIVKAAPAGLGALEGVTVDTSWDHLAEPDNRPPPQVDLSGIAMVEKGAEQTEHLQAPELKVDTSAMVLDEPGVNIVQPKPTKALEIDTSKLALE